MKIEPEINLDLPRYVSTKVAAAYLGRKPATLHAWSHLKVGPLAPIKINGRLAWRWSDLKALLQA